MIFLLISFCVGTQENLIVPKMCVDNLCFPRVIWSYWGDITLPEDIEEIFNVTRMSLVNFTYYFLNPSNLSDFLDIESFPKNYFELSPIACKADYIRVCLLEKYGGLWIDSSVFVNSAVELENFFVKSVNARSTLFGFFNDYEFVMTTYLFGAPEKSIVMKRFKEEYDFALTVKNTTEYWEIICNELVFHEVLKREWCWSPYYMIEHIFVYMIFKNESLNENVFLIPVNDSTHPARLLLECRHQKRCVRNRLENDPVARAYPFVKLSRGVRTGKKFNVQSDIEKGKKEKKKKGKKGNKEKKNGKEL